EIAAFGQKLSAWAGKLDDLQKAMLIDLLAKAGGDVYGNDAAERAVAPAGRPTDASSLSPLENDDFTHAIEGIFNARQETASALGH
ncbi:MAG: hypothetical protein ACYDCQ_18580, partial [Dehalococcoidia bacterium]